MITKKSKKNLIFKVLLLSFIILVLLSTIKVVVFNVELVNENNIYYIAIMKEFLFFTLSAMFMANIFYYLLHEDILNIYIKMKECSFRDASTGLYNRHYLNDFFDKYTNLNQENESYAIVLIDIDDFKLLNYNHGYTAGDCILKTLAFELQHLMHTKDVLCRYSNNGFVIILQGITQTIALDRVEYLRDKIKEMHFECDKSSISISIGLSIGTKDDDIAQVMQESDSALYMAKKTKKCSIEIFEK